jgi:hypothetical protein
MNRWLFLLVLSAALSAARAEIPIDAPIVDTPTNRLVPGINVPAPLGTGDATNAVVVPPPKPRSAPPAEEPWRRIEAPEEGNDGFTFTDGTRVPGAFLDLENGVIRWQMKALKEPVRIRTAGLRQLTLRARPRTAAPAPAGWLVLLADGSLLPARRVTFEDGQVVADLPYAGLVRLERRQVAMLRRYDPTGGGLVSLADAPLYAPAKRPPAGYYWPHMRYRDVKLPDPVLVEFPWDGCAPQGIELQLFTGKGEDLGRRSSGLQLRLNTTGAQVKWGADALPMSGVLTNCAGRTVWVGLAVNRKTGDMALYLDGQPQRRSFGSLGGLAGLPDFGMAVDDIAQRRLAMRSVLVSSINDSLHLPAPSAGEEAARLVNGDQIVGRLESLGTNEVVFHVAAGPMAGRMALPLDRVAQVAFPSVTNAPMRAGEVRVGLCDGSNVRGVWQRADARTATVHHAILGPVTFPRDALAEADGPAEPDAAGDEPPLVLEELAAGKRLRWVEATLRNRSVGIGSSHAGFLYRPGLMGFDSKVYWHGDLVGITNGVFRWQHPDALDPFAAPLAGVWRMFPLVRPLPARPAAELATVRLGNGDVLSGVLGEAGGETVNVTPWYAGPLAIPRKHAARITPHPAAADALEPRWEAVAAGQPPPALADGALWLTSARRHGPLPDRVRLDFEAVWPLAANPIRLHLFQRGDLMDAASRPEYLMVGVDYSGTTLGARVADTDDVTRIPSVGALTNRVGGCAQITVLADRPNRHLRLLVDGQAAGEWRGTNAVAPSGDALLLMASWHGGMALRHIVLREWREDPPAEPASRAAAPAQRSPVEARIVISQADAAQSSSGDVTIIFHNGDSLTLSDIVSDERTLTGKHKLLGPVSLNMAAVRALDWDRSNPRSVVMRW